MRSLSISLRWFGPSQSVRYAPGALGRRLAVERNGLTGDDLVTSQRRGIIVDRAGGPQRITSFFSTSFHLRATTLRDRPEPDGPAYPESAPGDGDRPDDRERRPTQDEGDGAATNGADADAAEPAPAASADAA